ncbi:RNA polymerase sigma factor [Thermogemmatispora onikobensis]|uniref:RNA polymerase sigma factor n=1 Tax=Thermogemmatispora onikobensis TaxID=732234 RepID=UPI0008532E29|nr:sigma-70 family RNA polymerase sigma factor [Thermogemmatispora onikobensis]
MDTSIRLYTTNGGWRSILDAARGNQPEMALPEEEQAAQLDSPGADTDMAEPDEEAETGAQALPLQAATTSQGEARSVDVADFEAIFQRYQTPITNFIYHMIGNREQAYDLAQDVFVKAYRALLAGTVIRPGALSSWLYHIAENTAIDALRRRRLISWLPLSLFNDDRGIGAGVLSETGSPTGDGFSGNSEDGSEGRPGAAALLYERGSYDGGRFESRVAEHEVVERVMRQLPPKYAVCLWLYEYHGFSCAEIAEMLNISPSAVKMRLMRARERFITLYRQEVGEE